MIVVDVETTGLNPAKHAVVSIGAMEFENPANQFYGECRIDEGAAVDEFSLRVNGFTRDQITDTSKPRLGTLTKEFLDWAAPIADRTLAGHNTYFDAQMLQAAVRQAKLRWPFGFRYLDLHSLGYAHLVRRGQKVPLYRGVSGVKSNFVHEYVGLPREPEPHIASTGAKMEAEAFSRLLHGKNLLDEYAQYPVPDYLEGLEQNPTLF